MPGKNYFSFLSDLSGSRIVRIALYLLAGSAAILLGWFIISRFAMDASALLGVISLVAIPLIVLMIFFVGLEKIAGISCMLGVEWVGKNTLQLFDWVIVNIKKQCGISPESAHPQEPPEDNTNSRASFSNSETAETAVQQTKPVEPVLDFVKIEREEPLQEHMQHEQQRLNDAEVEGKEAAKYAIAEQAKIAKNDLPHSELADVLLSDPIDNEPLFATDDAVRNDKEQVVIGTADDLTAINTSTEFPATEQDLQNIPIVINKQLEKQNFFDSETLSTEDKHQDMDSDDVLLTVVPELDEDVVELEIKALLDQQENKAVILPENELQKNADRVHDQTESKEKTGFNLNSVLEKTENNFFATDSDKNTKNNEGSTQEINIAQPVNVDKQTGNEVYEETDKLPLYSSMLSQAEQTATHLLSSFSEKLARTFDFKKEPDYHLPAVDLLQTHQGSVKAYSDLKLDEMSRSIERVLKDYKVIAEVEGAYPGPIITRFELSLAPGVKVSRVSGLAKDLARAMLVTSVRVVEIIEGTPYIGLEIPNQERELVSFREIISSEKFLQAVSPLTLALGKDVSGQTVVSDLAKMPHLLVAGTTGSGKSVAINTMILSMLYKATPAQVRMIMVDPKMLELSVYEGIPHLLTPVVTDMKEAQNALRWAVAEMERRYKLMSKVGVRNLAGFNQKIEEAAARGETIRDPLFQLLDSLEEGKTIPVLSALPSIVIIIDELADMMMLVGKKVEELIARLAQKARAAGIHLILATQRPSVDVLTGLIKANVPTRISFQVSSRIDSRTILDQGGAEALLGNGDMLFLPTGTSVPTRSHGAFVDDEEVHSVVGYLKTQGGANYLTEIIQEVPAEAPANVETVQDEEDELYPDAVHFVLETGKASISSVQRRFKVGYNRAARMIDQMEEESIVSEPEGNGSRRVLNREE